SEQSVPTAETTTEAPIAKTADPPTVFDASAPVSLPANALGGNMAGEVISRFTTLHDRTAYIIEPTRLTAVDVLTGEQQWQTKIEGVPADPNAQSGPYVNTDGPRPPFVSADGSKVVAAVPVAEPGKGTTPGHQAIAIMAVEAKSGEKTWETKVKVSDAVAGTGGQGATTEVVAVTDKVVVATYRNEEAMTVAIDAATQKPLWQRDAYQAGTVQDDIVIGVDSNVAENSSMSQATALALVTGEQKWVGALRASNVKIYPAGPSLVAIDSTDYGSGDPALFFLDPATGQEKTTLTHKAGFTPTLYGDCDYDDQSILICVANGVLTAHDSTGKTLWTLPDAVANRTAPTVTVAWHGAVYGKTQNGPVVLDAKTGKDLSTEPGIAPHWVSKYAAITMDKEGAPNSYPVVK
ncbi:MAG: PQQ-binding-like beta-propeller repeat protein, partial [Actinomycetota bacterium]|nr:PQQ-binding-like beta-propeller repeat protein [Actinomycetota bacterium]